MMTRQTGDVIEYQFLYLPKSSSVEDFTVIPWNEDAGKVWSQLKDGVYERDVERDLSLFDSDPWHVFGITNKTVQSRIPTEKSVPIVTGILKCSPDSDVSMKEHFMEYLKFHPMQDMSFEWILDAIMNEPIPMHFSRHVSENSVYWVDGRTGISTWAHPFYEKYSSMLQKARECRPFSDPKSVAVFQLGCITEPTESIENVCEVARILNVNLTEEPFLVPIMKGTLRHISAVKSVSTQTVDDVKYLIDQRRAEYLSLETTVKLQSAKTECIECETIRASFHCSDCGDFFCDTCFAYIHSSGSRKYSHRRTQVELFACADCLSAIAVFHCPNCKDPYCDVCFEKFHSRGGRRNHVPVIVKTGSGLTPKDSHNRRKLESMKSVWIKVADSAGIVYCNLDSQESRRDLPLAVVNED